MCAFELVIFDCDGVLVDSERITNEVFAQLLNELGLPISLEDMFEQFVGYSMNQCLQKITKMLGRAPDEDFAKLYRARAKVALESKLQPVAGIKEALDRIALPFCVASSGDHEKMRLTLGLTDLWSRFDGRVFSVSDVKNPKPAPDVYLFAAGKCGVLPKKCVVIEDSPTGVAAGLAAGMTVFGYSALMPSHRLLTAGAHLVFDSMEKLPKLISTYKSSA